jgi:hypothetical protein
MGGAIATLFERFRMVPGGLVWQQCIQKSSPGGGQPGIVHCSSLPAAAVGIPADPVLTDVNIPAIFLPTNICGSEGPRPRGPRGRP